MPKRVRGRFASKPSRPVRWILLAAIVTVLGVLVAGPSAAMAQTSPGFSCSLNRETLTIAIEDHVAGISQIDVSFDNAEVSITKSDPGNPFTTDNPTPSHPTLTFTFQRPTRITVLLTVSLAKRDATQQSRVGLEALGGGPPPIPFTVLGHCDPVAFTLGAAARPQTAAIPREEHALEVRNGRPGLRLVTVKVNRVTFRIDRMHSGDVRRLDISSALHAGGDNSIKVRGYGRRGGTARVFVWDGS